MPSLGGGFFGSSDAPQVVNFPLVALVTSPTSTLCVTEFEFRLYSGGGTNTAIGITFETAAFIQTSMELIGSETLLVEDGSADLVPAVTFVKGFRVNLANPTSYLRRVVMLPSTANAMEARLKFPRGLIIKPSNAICFYITSISGNQPFVPNLILNVRCDG